MFEGSVLAYNPAKDEAEWVPACGLANDITWAEERSAVALENYVLCIPEEAAWIARLGTRRIVSWPDDSSPHRRRRRHNPPNCQLWTPSLSGGKRVKMGPDRPTWRKKWSQTGSGARGTGRQSWRDWRD